MNILQIYLISVIYGFMPYLIERTLYQHKISKEGYKYNKINNSFIDDFMEILDELISSMIPIYNIVKGTKYIFELINVKTEYSNYKLGLLVKEKIYKDYNSKEEQFKDMFYTFGDMLGMDENDKKQFDKMIQIASLYEYACDNNFEICDNFDNMSIDNKYNYLKDAKEKIELNKRENIEDKNKSKCYDEMDTKEKIEYLKSEKNDIINMGEDKEKELIRKKD